MTNFREVILTSNGWKWVENLLKFSSMANVTSTWPNRVPKGGAYPSGFQHTTAAQDQHTEVTQSSLYDIRLQQQHIWWIFSGGPLITSQHIHLKATRSAWVPGST